MEKSAVRPNPDVDRLLDSNAASESVLHVFWCLGMEDEMRWTLAYKGK